jgi:quinohemoprotein ethanol dehydrogenase
MQLKTVVGTLLVLLAVSGCHRQEAAPQAAAPPVPRPAARVDAERLARAALEPDQWFTPGRDAQGTYHSPLTDINDQNVTRLGFAWDYATGTKRGLEATPLVVDGVMYAAGNWGRVYALDAATGKELWKYDPEVEGQSGRYACCDVVNRGLVAWKGRIYVASVDGYLHAIDAQTGRRVWRADTLADRSPKSFHYFITGAPQIAGDLIVIGNGGADFQGARGQVSAYSLENGAFKWRFYTVPRDPKLGPQDQAHLAAAVKTWPARYDWSMGGGGTVWDGLGYDAEANLVYVGTANASPYHGEHDPAGQGDELYVASIVAIHGDTGQLAWHYQEIPGEGWDFDTTNKLILADITVDGKPRKTIMQASKDGFLYTLDRLTGEFIAGKQFAYVNWTKGLDPKTHRPIINPAADWARAPTLIFPAAVGAHGWQPMSYDPAKGLMYIPVMDAGMVYVDTTKRRAGLIEGNFDLAFFFPEDYSPKDLESLLGKLPSLEALWPQGKVPKTRGLIRAIEPLTGKVVWEVQNDTVWDGGILSTDGNLVMRGDASGFLNIYAADKGTLLRRIDVGTSIMAAPMTYRVNGVQYIAFMAGYGGGVLFNPFPKDSAAYKYGNAGRIIALKLDGAEPTKPAPVSEDIGEPPPPREGTPATIANGEVLYNRYCARCHAFGRGLVPDLRRLPSAIHSIFYDVVLRGADSGNGMGRFDDVLTQQDAEAIHSYLVDQAWALHAPPAAQPAAGRPQLASPGISPELKHSWEVSFNNGDAAAVARLYSPEAQLIMSGSPVARGHAAIQSTIEAMIRSGVKARIDTEQNFGSGDLAYVYGHYSVLDKEGGHSVEDGHYIELWRRRDGAWLIDLDVNAAGPSPPPGDAH